MVAGPTLLGRSAWRLGVWAIFLTLTVLVFFFGGGGWSARFIHLGCGLAELVLQMPGPPFWVCICLFLTALFHPGFLIGVVALLLIWLASPFWGGRVPRRPACGVCVSRLLVFARVCSHVGDFNARNWCLTAGLLRRCCRCRGLRGAFSGFCRWRCGLVSGFSVGLESLLLQGLSEPEFCGDLVCRFGKIRGMADFSDQLRKVVVRYRRVGCGLGVVRQSACLVVGPIAVGGCAALFGCAPVVRASGSVLAPAWGCSFWWVGTGAFVCCLIRRGSTGCLLLLRVFGGVVWRAGDLRPSCGTLCLSSPRLCFFVVVWFDLSVGLGGSLAGWGWSCGPGGRLDVCATSVTGGGAGLGLGPWD